MIEASADMKRESEKEWYFGNADKERRGPFSYEEVRKSVCLDSPLVILTVLLSALEKRLSNLHRYCLLWSHVSDHGSSKATYSEFRCILIKSGLGVLL